jgi:UPF0716 family protein affecting phage T7 exclusion
MKWKRRVGGGIVAFIGFMLSPLSWWNDLFVNIPLALGFAWVVSLVHRPAFMASFVVGYWLTNVLGFVLMHRGGGQAITGDAQPYSRRALLRDVGISLAYTLVIVALIKFGILKPLPDYLPNR